MPRAAILGPKPEPLPLPLNQPIIPTASPARHLHDYLAFAGMEFKRLTVLLYRQAELQHGGAAASQKIQRERQFQETVVGHVNALADPDPLRFPLPFQFRNDGATFASTEATYEEVAAPG